MKTERFDAIRRDFDGEIKAASTEGEVLEIKGRYVGKKRGILRDMMSAIKELPPEERRAYGQAVNALKREMEAVVADALVRAKSAKTAPRALDVTLPGIRPEYGSLHPITRVRREIESIFLSMGYAIETGPEIEDCYHNFEALNTPADHPSRDIQDTFYISDKVVLRTQTSPVQVRTMESRKPPIKIIAPGRVFRRDDDVSHSPMFFQVEGLVVDEGISMAHLKGTLRNFYSRLFGRETEVRFRPSYFPFTEPSAETDLACVLCGGSGCSVCKGTGWLEVGGCGMIDPAVFGFVDIDPERYTGFAFGLGIDRMAMLRYGIDHIRHFFENDVRFLRQF